MWISLIRLAVVKVILTVCCIVVFGSNGYAAEPNGIVRVEGKYIKRIVLIGEHQETLTEPTGTITLPVGTYYISEIELQGEYLAGRHNLPAQMAKLIVKQDETTVLKLGAPLTQNVVINRRGNSLLLSYKLQGIGGEAYNEKQDRVAPKFAVYKDDTQIGSGAFKYG